MRRAFSMIELSISMAIAGLVTTAAVSAFAGLNRQLTTIGASTRAADESKTLVAHSMVRLQEVGGGSLRPWDSVVVQPPPAAAQGPAPATTTTSRVWYGLSVGGAVDCPIHAITDTEVVTTEVCCLSNMLAMVKNGHVCPEGLVAQAILADGDTRHQRGITLATVNEATHTCRLQTIDGFMSFADRGEQADLVGGVLTPVLLQVLAVDESTHELVEHRDRNSDGVMADDERLLLADGVYAFRARLGWDEDDNGVEPDEWTTGAEAADRTRLRQIELGVVVGASLHDVRLGNTVSFGGVDYHVPGQRLEATVSKALFRNLFLFLN